MLKWTIGRVSITPLVEMQVELPYDESGIILIREASPAALKDIRWLSPNYVSEDGLMKIAFQAFLVEAPGIRMIVDTCVGNAKPRETMMTLHTAFLEDLSTAGFGRDAVDIVVCTHLHYDHVGWNTMLEDGDWVPTFPRARYLLGRKEFDHFRSTVDAATPDDRRMLADSLLPVIEAGLVDFVDSDHRISPEIRLHPTEGHTPGHVSVVIESLGETAVITGDMVHHPCQIARPDWASFIDFDAAAAASTRRREFAEWESTGTLVIGTHFSAPTAGRLVRDGDNFRLEGDGRT